MKTFSTVGFCLFSIFCLIFSISKLNMHLSRNYLKGLSLKGSRILYDETPEGYVVNPHVNFDVSIDANSNYQVQFRFRGHKKKDWNWKWSYVEKITDEAILKFGIPKSLFKPYYPVDSVVRKRNLQMNDGMFVQDGRYLRPDMNKMINYYRPFLEPISSLVTNSLNDEDTWRDRIEMLMKFCQDIPYGVPPKYFNEKYIGGVFPPPQVFVNKFGDCDSKAVIFASAASHFKNTDVVLLFETGHVLPAVKGIPKPYDVYYTYQNETYIMADTAGPGRNGFGMVSDPYQKINKVIKVEIF